MMKFAIPFLIGRVHFNIILHKGACLQNGSEAAHALAVLGDEMRCVHYDRLTSGSPSAAIGVVEVASRMMHCVFESRRGG
jgi:hypothetical protein